MSTSRLSIYNGAIRLVGGDRLSSLDESNTIKRHLDDVWDADGVVSCLQAGQWNWASRTVALAKSDGIVPDFGFQNAFERPSDFVRLVGLSSSERMQRPLTNYETAGELYFADVEVLYLRYVSKGTSYGLDYSLWPADFARYVEAFFAAEIAPKVTASDSKTQRLDMLRDERLKMASSNDAMSGPSKSIPSGSWVRSRHARNGSSRYVD